MNGFKKFMGASLAALMIAGTGTMTFAKDFNDVTADNKAATEISILTDMGIIKGTHDNIFSPDEEVTREQMALLMFRLMLNKEDAGRVNTTSFKDLYEPYYNGAISWANAAGYIKGHNDDIFDPTGGITLQDAMTMLVRALGQDNEKMNENYPWSYINAGIKLGLDRGLEDIDYTETLTRAETAVILYNAMTAEYLIPKTTTNGSVYYESTSIIEEVFGYEMADAVIVATNNYSIDGQTVVKKNYVTLRCTDQEGKISYMTVPYGDLDLKEAADSRIGDLFRIIYQAKNNKATVLSAVSMSETKEFDEVKLDADKNLLEIGGVKYTLVEEYSDELSTNNHELILHAFDDDGNLEQIESLSELESLLGFYKVNLFFDKGADLAHRGIIKTFEMGRLNIDADGKINLAGGLAEKELEGGFNNEVKAANGDFVLYYFNEHNKDLEIAEILDIVGGTVKRITADTVKIGNNTYALGNPGAGISAESIRNQLNLGADVTAVIWNEAVVSVVEGVSQTSESTYLIAESDSQRVYENGSFKYVATVFVNGKKENVYLSANNAQAGKIYRYTVNNGVYTLIEAEIEDGIILTGSDKFVQSDKDHDELAYIINEANGTTIELNGRNYYTILNGEASANASVSGLNSVKFVTNSDTVIIVNDNGKLIEFAGAYNSTFRVNDGATVAAIFDNEVGSVETLRYLYISDGSLGNYSINAEYVRILSVDGGVIENGVNYIEYTVYNFMTGKVETRLSRFSNLTVGEDYRTGTDNCITNEASNHVVNGFVTGYTAGTITIDGTTFPLAEGIKALKIENGKVTDIAIRDLYMTNVEFVVDNNEITHIIAGEAASFEAAASGNEIVINPGFELSDFASSSLKAVELVKGEEKISVEGASAAYGENNTIVFTLASELAAGEYTLTFNLGGKTFAAEFEVAQPEQPEQVGGQAVLGRQDLITTPWLTERHGYDPTLHPSLRQANTL